MAVRPEDVLPHSLGHELEAQPNHLPVRVMAMEFLGSFWRVHLGGADMGDTPLFANFSMNAVRRFQLTEGTDLTVELPADRVLVFDQAAQE